MHIYSNTEKLMIAYIILYGKSHLLVGNEMTTDNAAVSGTIC